MKYVYDEENNELYIKDSNSIIIIKAERKEDEENA